MKPNRWLLLLEFVVLFVALPIFLYWATLHSVRLVLPALFGVTIYTAVILGRDSTFDRSAFFSLRPIRQQIRPILFLFVPGALLLGLLVWLVFPERFLSFPRARPGIWLAVMLIYPILSVYPQQVIFRAFLYQRYPMMHGQRRWNFVAFSGVVFAFLHVVYFNWIAPGLTLMGGLIFADTFWRSRSLMASWLEHSLWGNFIFTIGLGQFFYYHGGMLPS